jgi:hypothetical protein
MSLIPQLHSLNRDVFYVGSQISFIETRRKIRAAAVSASGYSSRRRRPEYRYKGLLGLGRTALAAPGLLLQLFDLF